MTQPILVVENELKRIMFELDLMKTRKHKLEKELSILTTDIQLHEIEVLSCDKAIKLLKKLS